MSEQQNHTPERRTTSIDDLAQILGISRNGAYQAAKRGEIPVIRIGKRLLVPTAGIERMLGDNAQPRG